MSKYEDWRRATLGELEHFPDCQFQNAPMDVCDCYTRHAFAAGAADKIEELEMGLEEADEIARTLNEYRRIAAVKDRLIEELEQEIAIVRAAAHTILTTTKKKKIHD